MSFITAETLVSISILLTGHIYFKRHMSFHKIKSEAEISSNSLYGAYSIILHKITVLCVYFLARPRFCCHCCHCCPLNLLVSVVDTGACERTGGKSFSTMSQFVPYPGFWESNFTSMAPWPSSRFPQVWLHPGLSGPWCPKQDVSNQSRGMYGKKQIPQRWGNAVLRPTSLFPPKTQLQRAWPNGSHTSRGDCGPPRTPRYLLILLATLHQMTAHVPWCCTRL